ncbi:MAG: hypothetical protein HKN93_00500 [Acidimicrobiia bacterium]|nr:hypothetical protein [Acidimicrobiia bacterium]
MKAAVHNDYGPPEKVMAVQDVDVPTIKPSQVLVRIQGRGPTGRTGP